MAFDSWLQIYSFTFLVPNIVIFILDILWLDVV